jgi:hemerythrin-like metal-binding protein
MQFMNWNDRLSTGVADIDADHKRLLGMANELFDAIMSGSGKEALGSLFDRLSEYAETHFKREEALFEGSNYPDVARHKQEHRQFTLWVNDARSRFHNGAIAGPSLEVMDYLKDWLFDHIAGRDKQCSRYLAKGVVWA